MSAAPQRRSRAESGSGGAEAAGVFTRHIWHCLVTVRRSAMCAGPPRAVLRAGACILAGFRHPAISAAMSPTPQLISDTQTASTTKAPVSLVANSTQILQRPPLFTAQAPALLVTN